MTSASELQGYGTAPCPSAYDQDIAIVLVHRDKRKTMLACSTFLIVIVRSAGQIHLPIVGMWIPFFSVQSQSAEFENNAGVVQNITPCALTDDGNRWGECSDAWARAAL